MRRAHQYPRWLESRLKATCCGLLSFPRGGGPSSEDAYRERFCPAQELGGQESPKQEEGAGLPGAHQPEQDFGTGTRSRAAQGHSFSWLLGLLSCRSSGGG